MDIGNLKHLFFSAALNIPVQECLQYNSKIELNKCSLCIHNKVVFSNSQKPYGLAFCNRIKCQLEICENKGEIALFCKWGGHH